MEEKKKTSGRGFASMDKDKQREIASRGGKAAHAKGTAHEFTTDEARAAGKKGGEAVSRRPGYMAKIGGRGGRKNGFTKCGVCARDTKKADILNGWCLKCNEALALKWLTPSAPR